MRDQIIHVNKEAIKCMDLEVLGWGFHFFVESESKAYKAAYAYRHHTGKVKVEFAEGVQRWIVTVFD